MKNIINISESIKPFKKSIQIEGDKSLSIRWALLASQANGKSISKNLLMSDDVINTLNCLKKLGIKIILNKKKCEISGKGLNGFNFKKKIILNAGNSGTLARLLPGLLIHANKEIIIKGDKSLSKRDFYRITKPLEKFGANFITNNGKLPLKIKGTNYAKPIKYFEKKGSAQCKSSVMLAALNTKGTTEIKARKSRNHSELLFRYLNLNIKVKKTKHFDIIKINGKKTIKPFNYKIPTDISSSAFFIVLTTLSKKSKLKIKSVNINPTRIGILRILKKMGVKITIKNEKVFKGEKIGDLHISSNNSLKPIDCSPNLNSSAIDEFLLIFLVAAKANGVSRFRKLSELNQKESPRLNWGSKLLRKIGIKNVVTKDSIKIYGNPNLYLNKNITIKNFLKDHRVFMTSVVAALVFGGNWKIYDKDSIKTSFPSFLTKIRELGAKI